MLSNCGVREVSWESLGTARRSSQSILKEISPEYSLEGLILKLKLQYFVHLMQRADSLEKTLMLGETEGRRRTGEYRGRYGWRAALAQWTWIWANSGWWWRTGKTVMLHSMGLQESTQLGDWPTTKLWLPVSSYFLIHCQEITKSYLPGLLPKRQQNGKEKMEEWITEKQRLNTRSSVMQDLFSFRNTDKIIQKILAENFSFK